MKNNYDLQKLQKKILEIIVFIDDFCKSNDIKYYLIYGSCLGAVRHNGFIPWDDDFDIGMTLDNYNKFCKLLIKNKHPKYFLQTIKTDPNYNLLFAKVRDTETTYIESKNKNVNMINGVYVDIFPIIGYPNKKSEQLFFKINRAILISPYSERVNNKYLKFICKGIIKILGKKKVNKIFYKKVFKYDLNICNKWISVYGDLYEKNIISKECYGVARYIKFEDLTLPIPENYNYYLGHIYGDYKKIPSKEDIEKNQHPVYLMDLDNPYTNYIKDGKIYIDK